MPSEASKDVFLSHRPLGWPAAFAVTRAVCEDLQRAVVFCGIGSLLRGDIEVPVSICGDSPQYEDT